MSNDREINDYLGLDDYLGLGEINSSKVLLEII
jgi:hypothetical protein